MLLHCRFRGLHILEIRNGSCMGSSAGIAAALALVLQHLSIITGTIDYLLMRGDNPLKGGTRGGLLRSISILGGPKGLLRVSGCGLPPPPDLNRTAD